jgi:hypothetical protein
MKILIRLLGSCICAIAFLNTTSVVAAGYQSIIPIPDISNKLRREAGLIVDKVDGEEYSSGSRGRFAFKKGKAGFAAFSKSRGRFAFKKGKAGFAAFSKSRGQNQTEPSIEMPTKIRLPLVIAPLTPQNGLGLSMTAQPNLYWYMSYWWEGDLAFTLNEFGNEFGTGEPVPVIEDSIRRSDCQKYPDEANEGKDAKDDLICHLRLADYGVRLEPNKDYEWFVFIVMDPEQRTSDWLSSAFVRYTQPSGQLTRRLNSTPLAQRFSIYKENDFWYDAINNLVVQIEAINNLAIPIEQQPKNKALREKLKYWIEQEKMLNVAEFLVEGCAGCFHELGVE